VAVPLGPREALGVVWADNVAVQPGLHNRLKDVAAKLDYPPLNEELRRFVEWVANYTLSPRGMVLRMALRMGELGPERERVGVRLAGPPPQRLTPARRRVLAALEDGLLRTKPEAAKDAGVSVGVIDGLVDEGTLEAVALPPEPVARQPDPDYREPELTGRSAWPPTSCAARCARAASRSTCSTGSPARAKPKSTSKRSPRPSARAARRWSCCPRSRSPDSSSIASRSASACARPNGIPSLARASARAPGRRSRPAR
jgi:hypothetical protein